MSVFESWHWLWGCASTSFWFEIWFWSWIWFLSECEIWVLEEEDLWFCTCIELVEFFTSLLLDDSVVPRFASREELWSARNIGVGDCDVELVLPISQSKIPLLEGLKTGRELTWLLLAVCPGRRFCNKLRVWLWFWADWFWLEASDSEFWSPVLAVWSEEALFPVSFLFLFSQSSVSRQSAAA